MLTVALSVIAQVSSRASLPSHPRLLMTNDDIPELLSNIEDDKTWTDVNKTLLKECDKMLALTPKEPPANATNELGVSREYLRRVLFLSYAYRTTGEKKYLDHAVVELRRACTFVDWHPGHFLDVAEMTFAMAIGYDWLYNDLSRNDRRLVRNAIIQKGLNPSLEEANMRQFNTISSNWNQVCHAAIVCASIAVWEDNRELSAELINRAIRNVTVSMNTYAPEGVYPEGAMYWEYGTNNSVILIAALEKAFGSDFNLSNMPGFLETGYYYNNMFTPASHCFTYSDNGSYGANDMPPAIYWLYKKTGDQSMLYSESRQVLRSGVGRIGTNRYAPLTVIWGSSAHLKSVAPPDGRLYLGNGSNSVAVMRSSWSNNRGWYLGAKLGTPAATHGHMDVGSFFLEYNMVVWGADLGLENYVKLERNKINVWGKGQNAQRWDIFRYNPNNHNMVTFDRQKQLVSASATIDSHSDDGETMSVGSDLSRLYNGQVRRYERFYSLTNDDRCIITDEISTASSTTMNWNLMSQVSKITTVSDNVLLLEHLGRKMYLIVDAPVKIEWEIGDATPDKPYENKNAGYKAIRFTASLKGGSDYRFTATFTTKEPE